MRDQVSQELGTADIIVNNAVTQYPWKTVIDQPLEDYESQWKTCVMHNVLMSKAFVSCDDWEEVGKSHWHQHRVRHAMLRDPVGLCIGEARDGWRAPGSREGSR